MSESKFLLISPNAAEAGALETLPPTPGLRIMKNDEVINENLRFSPDDLICITSEASIELVKNRMDDPVKKNALAVLKDKFRFREILTGIYPDYQFRKLSLSDIESLSVNSKVILKPSKGCFGTAVKTIYPDSDMELVIKEIKQELLTNGSVLSSEVLSDNEFILEEYIEGEEYAVDMFYDGQGRPHVVNIYHHPMPENEAYLHMIYYSSKAVFDRIYDKAMVFFEALNSVLNVKNFPMHSEFRYHQDSLQPIEINSMRFGGMGLGNMSYYSMGLNPYESFKRGQSPDWDDVWKSNNQDDVIYAFFIAYNGTQVDTNKEKPNIEKLKREFTEVLHEEHFDYQSQLAFGIFCLKESSTNLRRLLSIDFNEYFEPIS